MGGGIDNAFDGTPFGFGATRVTATGCTIIHNEAIGGSGNAGSSPRGLVGAGLGGGIANYLGATADVDAGTISHNRAVGGDDNASSGGPAAAGLGAGGAVFNALGDFVLDTGDVLAPSVVKLTNGTLEHNQALGGQDASGDGWGGAIANLFAATTTVAGSTLADNLAVGDPGADGGHAGNGYGGGAYNDATSSLTLSASTATRNHANGGDANLGGSDGEGIGGGVYNLGSFDFDALTLIAANHAETSDDDLFDPFA